MDKASKRAQGTHLALDNSSCLFGLSKGGLLLGAHNAKALPWPSSRGWSSVPQKSAALQEALAVCDCMGAFPFLWARASIVMGNMHGLFCSSWHPFLPTCKSSASLWTVENLSPSFPRQETCWGNLLGRCSNNSSLGRAGLSEVLEVLTVIPQILGVGGGIGTAREAVSNGCLIGQAESWGKRGRS